jgi:hypothetical protein
MPLSTRLRVEEEAVMPEKTLPEMSRRQARNKNGPYAGKPPAFDGGQWKSDLAVSCRADFDTTTRKCNCCRP